MSTKNPGNIHKKILPALVAGSLMYLMGMPKLACIGTGIFCAAVPGALEKYLRARRLRKFEEELQESLPSFSAALRAGHTVQRCMSMAAEKGNGPFAEEMARIYAAWRRGRPLEELLAESRDASRSREYRIFCSAVLLSKRAGCSLGTMFDALADVLRQRRGLREKLAALTSMAKAQALAACIVVVGFFIMLQVADPEYGRPLFVTDTGKNVLSAAALMLATGIWMIRKMSLPPGEE